MNYQEALMRIMGPIEQSGDTSSPRPPRDSIIRMESLFRLLGDPHRATPTVHVAGTKGKGSTASFIAAILKAGGYSTGLFTSPHLHTFTERIRLNGELIEQKRFGQILESILPYVDRLEHDKTLGRVSMFEMLLAMACVCFKQEMDFQVIEAFLGGRRDYTNVMMPEVSVITSISLDHTELLGDTVEQIAEEKAGIIKPGVPVVTAPQPKQALAVIRDVAREKGSSLTEVSSIYSWQLKKTDLHGQNFDISFPGNSYSLWTPLLGEHQLENAATSLAALNVLKSLGFPVSDKAIVEGFRQVDWPGRMQILSDDPLLVVDGAHNPYSIAKLRQAIVKQFPDSPIRLVFGANTGKNLDAMICELAPIASAVTICTSRTPHATSTKLLSELFQRYKINSVEIGNVGMAVRSAIKETLPNELILVTGSIFVVAEAIEEVKGLTPELYPWLQPS